MSRRVLSMTTGIFVGVVVGMVVMMGLHLASTLVYPLPDDVDFMSTAPENQENMNAWFAQLPAGAFVLATLCHGLGCMAGAAAATLISGRQTMIPAITIGILFTACGIMNLSSVPHPTWFPLIDLPIYLILAIVAGKLLVKNDHLEPEPSSSAIGDP